MPPSSSPTETKGIERASFSDLRLVAMSLGSAAAVAALFTSIYSFSIVGWEFSLPLLWATGIWCAGVALGFLFGIPKVLQGTPAAAPPPGAEPGGAGGASTTRQATVTAPASYQQRVNTNLEEISDWLTKIIVGVTLVQLKELPPQFSRLADHIVSNLPGGGHRGFGLAIILCFATLGFLFGYLVTRLYIQGALARAERGLTDFGGEFEQQRIAAQVTSAMLTQATKAIERHAPAARDGNALEPPKDVQDELNRLAEEYKSINITDWRRRTRAKTDLAAKLFSYAVAHGVSRDWLASREDEVLLLALAGAVQAAPTAEDTARLLQAGPRAKRKHVQYFIVLALRCLLEQNMVTSKERDGIRSLLDLYGKTADDSLRSLIESTRAQL